MPKIQRFSTRIPRAIAAACRVFVVSSAVWMGLMPVIWDEDILTAHAQAAIVCANVSISAATTDAIATFAGTDQYAFQAGDTITISANGSANVRVRIFFNGAVVSDQTIGAGGAANDTFTFNAAETGQFIIEITNNVTNQMVSVLITCTPAVGNSGDENDNADNTGGIGTQQAAALIDGTLSTTNPETLNGDVFNPFGVNLSEALFEAAAASRGNQQENNGPSSRLNTNPPSPAERQPAEDDRDPPGPNDEGDQDSDTSKACENCKQELAALRAQFAQLLNEGRELVDQIEKERKEDLQKRREQTIKVRGNAIIQELADIHNLTFEETVEGQLQGDTEYFQIEREEVVLDLENNREIEEFALKQGVQHELILQAFDNAEAALAERRDDEVEIIRKNQEANIKQAEQGIKAAESGLNRARARLGLEDTEIEAEIKKLQAEQETFAANNPVPEGVIFNDTESVIEKRREIRENIRTIEQSATENQTEATVPPELLQQEALLDKLSEMNSEIVTAQHQDISEKMRQVFREFENLDNPQRKSREEDLVEAEEHLAGAHKRLEFVRQDPEAQLSPLLQKLFAREVIAVLNDNDERGKASPESVAKLKEVRHQINVLEEKIGRKSDKCEQICQPNGQTSSRNVPSNSNQADTYLAYATEQRETSVFGKVIDKRRMSFNDRFSGRKHARGVTVLGYGPRRATSTNGVTAVSERSFNTRFDLRQWREKQKKIYAQTVRFDARGNPVVQGADPLIDLPGFFGDNRFNIFAASNITLGRNDASNLDQDSLSYAVSGGVSWLVIPRLNIGIAGRYSNGDVDSAISTIDTATWGIAGFAQTQLDLGLGKINLEAIGAYSRSEIDSLFNNAGVITTTDTHATAFSSQVRASTLFEYEKVRISPYTSLSYISTDRDSFTLSDGQFAPGLVNDQVVLSAGSSIATSFLVPETELIISPSLGLGVFGAVTDGGSVGLSANGGLGIRTKRGLSSNLGVGFSGLTGGTSNLSFSSNFSLPLN